METLTPPPAAETTTTTPAVVTPEVPATGLHEMTKPERDSFLRDGKIPAREKKADSLDGKTAESSTAPAQGKKAAETAAKDVKAASEPAAPAKDKKDVSKAEHDFNRILTDRRRETDRANHAERERDELTKRIAALESKAKPDGKGADSSSAADPSEPKWKQIAASKEFPKIEDFDNPNEWAAAVHLHTQQQIETALTARDQHSAESQQEQRVAQDAFTRGASEIEADPTILDRIDPGLEELPGARAIRAAGREPNVNHFIKDVILFDSEKPLNLMAFYSTPEGKTEWDAMRRMDDRGRQRTIIAREVQLGSTVPPGDAAKGDEKKPAAKTFTKAPAPPEKEGPKGAVATDGAESAVKTGDFAAFEREMDARGDGQTRRYGRRRAS